MNDPRKKTNKKLMKEYFQTKSEITSIYKNIIVASEKKANEVNRFVKKIEKVQKDWNYWYSNIIKEIEILNKKLISIEKRIK